MRLIPGDKWRIVTVIRETQSGVSLSPWERKSRDCLAEAGLGSAALHPAALQPALGAFPL